MFSTVVMYDFILKYKNNVFLQKFKFIFKIPVYYLKFVGHLHANYFVVLLCIFISSKLYYLYY